MEQKNKFPYIENLIKSGKTDFIIEQNKSAEEVAFWESHINSDDLLIKRQANGNIESARGRLRQLNEYIEEQKAMV